MAAAVGSTLRPGMIALEYHPTPFRWVVCKAAGMVTRRAYCGVLSPLRLVRRPIPALPGPGWVRLRTILGGVCGTDLALITQRAHPATILQSFASFPAVLGHENVAAIDAVGVEVSGWPAGRRVCVEPALGCAARGVEPPCRHCAEGRTSLCEAMASSEHDAEAVRPLPPRAMIGLNARTGGSWASYFVAHRSQLHAVPDGLSDEAAVLTDPLASAAHAVLRRRPREGEQVLVNGSGIIALGLIAVLRTLGCANRITAVVRHGFQAEIARRLGADSVIEHRRQAKPADRYDDIARRIGGRRVSGRFGNQAMLGGFDLVYDCTGSGRGLTDVLKWARSRGSVVAVGTSGIALMDTTPLWFDEIEMIGANGRQVETVDGRRVHGYDLVLEWMRSGGLDTALFPVTRFDLREYRAAFRQLLTRGRHPIVKAAFEPLRDGD